jgi:hypothetical protein
MANSNISAKELIRLHHRGNLISTIVFLVLLVITLYFARDSFWWILLAFAWLWLLIYGVKELYYFYDNFGHINRHLVNWEYPNGDLLIVTCWGLLKHNTTRPKISVSTKFEGFKWGLDNAKDFAEALIKTGGNPLSALIPSIEFSTTTNAVEDYITFSFVDNIDLTFIDTNGGFLIINIEKKNYDKKYTLSYPLPPGKTSIEAEALIFESRIQKRATPVRALYVDKLWVEEIERAEHLKSHDSQITINVADIIIPEVTLLRANKIVFADGVTTEVIKGGKGQYYIVAGYQRFYYSTHEYAVKASYMLKTKHIVSKFGLQD